MSFGQYFDILAKIRPDFAGTVDDSALMVDKKLLAFKS